VGVWRGGKEGGGGDGVTMTRNNRAALAIGAAIAFSVSAGSAFAATDKPFTIGNYPVEATAKDAVTAKDRAMADGQQAAFRSLLKRLVPVTDYNRLGRLKTIPAGGLIDGVSVRAERNSATQYIATLDFSFQADAVREHLRREGIPFVDAQAPDVVVVPVYQMPAAGQAAAPAELSQAEGSRLWTEVWKGLDLEHALAPVKLEPLRGNLPADAVRRAKDGDGGALNAFAREYRSDLVLLAVLEPDLTAKRLHVTLAGQDAVGDFILKRTYRFIPQDVAYTAELAAVVALGTLEGRWKAVKLANARDGLGAPAGGLQPVQLLVEFRNGREWQDLHRQIAETPGVENFEVGAFSARGADVTLRFPGGGGQLAEALSGQGLEVRNFGGTWQVRLAF
jgi:Uncharacterized protein conserved in bacteria (DUF2066)